MISIIGIDLVLGLFAHGRLSVNTLSYNICSLLLTKLCCKHALYCTCILLNLQNKCFD